MHATTPRRIVCLTEETTELLYLLQEQDRIVGISGYTVRPAQARREKPKVSAFTSAKLDKITALKPDMVFGFSDLQADIAADLIRQGIEVHIFNQRSVQEILNMMLTVGSLVGAQSRVRRLIDSFTRNLESVQQRSSLFATRPRVYFEEWNDPLISGIQWVSELVQIAGGVDCFPELGRMPLGKDRIIADPLEVVTRNPDIIIGSWCGRKFRPDQVRSRPGWQNVTAVREDFLHEVKSAEILQPGPAALSDGVGRIHDIIMDWHNR